ncbi:MAG: lysylphosphatidylglycerol synthase transmembrane domain-containing protein [Chloroflexota bacterium]|nr:lysylphosphatidylglycerol synthase transmembrane domain-containing protein [Chloroflexota bacterium]MDE2908753.1 lysylphosphatidylglycerol synthase transmembrane domain-containing protein [Chloroflexota bacterium]
MTDETRRRVNSRDKGGSRRQFLVRAASIAITVGLLADLVGRVNWAEFDQLLGRVTATSWLGALLAYLTLNLFRALRFRILLDKRDSPWRILAPITLYHNFLVRALPFKLGELSYILLLRSRLNYSMEEGVSSLFGARVLELLIIVMVFASSIPASADELAAQRDELTLAIAVTFALSVIALYFGGNLIRAFQKAARPLVALAEGKRPGIAAGADKRLRQLADEMDRIRQPRLFLTALFTTCFTYTSSFLTNYILLGALGVNVELPVFIAIISLGMFASAFPFTVSGFGVVEAAWRFGLMQFANMPDGDATAAGFLLHGFQIFAAAVYGLLGYLLIHISAPMPAQGATNQK